MTAPASAMLKLWTITDHPADQPDAYVARRFSIEADGLARPETIAFVASAIGTLRDIMQRAGLHSIPRSPGDDPVIVESWI